MFQAAHFLVNCLGAGSDAPHGVSRVKIIYALVRQTNHLGAYTLSCVAYDKLQRMKVPGDCLDQLKVDMLAVHAKPARDNPQLLPVCCRCGAANALLKQAAYRGAAAPGADLAGSSQALLKESPAPSSPPRSTNSPTASGITTSVPAAATPSSAASSPSTSSPSSSPFPEPPLPDDEALELIREAPLSDDEAFELIRLAPPRDLAASFSLLGSTRLFFSGDHCSLWRAADGSKHDDVGPGGDDDDDGFDEDLCNK